MRTQMSVTEDKLDENGALVPGGLPKISEGGTLEGVQEEEEDEPMVRSLTTDVRSILPVCLHIR